MCPLLDPLAPPPTTLHLPIRGFRPSGERWSSKAQLMPKAASTMANMLVTKMTTVACTITTIIISQAHHLGRPCMEVKEVHRHHPLPSSSNSRCYTPLPLPCSQTLLPLNLLSPTAMAVIQSAAVALSTAATSTTAAVAITPATV